MFRLVEGNVLCGRKTNDIGGLQTGSSARDETKPFRNCLLKEGIHSFMGDVSSSEMGK